MERNVKLGKLIGYSLIVIVVGIIVIPLFSEKYRQAGNSPTINNPPPAQAPASVPAAVVKKETPLPEGYDPTKKEEREKLIDSLQKKGVLGNIRVSNSMGKLEVTPLFMSIRHDQKQSFTGLVYAWCLDTDLNCSGVRLIDPISGNDVGSFSPTLGLKMKK